MIDYKELYSQMLQENFKLKAEILRLKKEINTSDEGHSNIETVGFEFPTGGDWIYESPDGGETIYRRKVGEEDRVLVKGSNN